MLRKLLVESALMTNAKHSAAPDPVCPGSGLCPDPFQTAAPIIMAMVRMIIVTPVVTTVITTTGLRGHSAQSSQFPIVDRPGCALSI